MQTAEILKLKAAEHYQKLQEAGQKYSLVFIVTFSLLHHQ